MRTASAPPEPGIELGLKLERRLCEAAGGRVRNGSGLRELHRADFLDRRLDERRTLKCYEVDGIERLEKRWATVAALRVTIQYVAQRFDYPRR